MYLRTAVIVVWISMTAWLVRYEAFPELFTHTVSGYKGLLSKELLISDSWMKIMFRGAGIGYSHSSMDINENDTREHYLINNRVHIAFSVAGTRKNIHVLSTVILDVEYNLRRFSFSMSSPFTTVKVEGVHVKDSNYDVIIVTPSGTNNTTVHIPDDALLYSPISETALKQLKPGQQISISTVDPVSFRKTNLLFHGLRQERIKLSGEEIDTVVVGTEYNGIKIFSWLDGNGKVVRQDSQIGWTMQKCTPEEAYDATLSPGTSDEMIRNIMPFFLSQE